MEERIVMAYSKNLIRFLSVFILSSILTGCGSIDIQPKNIVIELGEDAPQKILDYVSSAPEEEEELERKAKLDISEINNMAVGEYHATVRYQDQEIIIPVEVRDTTPPVIHLKNVSFRELEEVKANDLAEATDLSDAVIYIINAEDGKELDSIWLRPDEEIMIKAVDSYNNEATMKFKPNVIINDEEIGVPSDRIYDDIDDFPFYEMEFADDEIYDMLKSAYGEIEWEAEFEKGNPADLEEYKSIFKEFLLFERTYLDLETGEELLLKDFPSKDYPSVVVPDGIEGSYDMADYEYYLFDMNGDGAQELCIYVPGSFLAIFQYDKSRDQIVLWTNLNLYYHLGGSRTIFCSNDGLGYDLFKLKEDATLEMRVRFYQYSYREGMVYCVYLPRYADEDKKIQMTEELRQKCYYDRWGQDYFFRVTEAQYKELTEAYFELYDQIYDRDYKGLRDVTYTYEELVGADGIKTGD